MSEDVKEVNKKYTDFLDENGFDYLIFTLKTGGEDSFTAARGLVDACLFGVLETIREHIDTKTWIDLKNRIISFMESKL